MPVPAVGNQVDEAARGSVQGLIDDALGKGALAVSSGAATVIDGINPSMRLYQDESFGPVVAVIRVADEEEAVRVANDSEYGLSAAVFTSDAARGVQARSPNPLRHLSRERADRAGRTANAVRRCRLLWLWPVRR